MYWWPPSLYAFDPSVRAFDWHLEDSGRGFSALVPSEYDEAMIKTCLSSGAMPFVREHGGLAAYEQMIALRTPDDPPKGGLGPDVVNPDGSVTIQYFDFSDANHVRRKRVTYVAGKDGSPEIANRNASEGGVPQEWVNGRWQKEGADAEREFGKAGVSILQAIGSIASAVMSLAGAGAFGAAFGAMWSFTMQQLKNAGHPPSVDDVINLATSFGKAVGPGIWGVVSKNPEIQTLMKDGFIAKMSKLPGTYGDKIAGAVNDLGHMLPRLNLPATLPGFDLSSWAKGALKNTPINLSPDAMIARGKAVRMGSVADAVPIGDFQDSRRWAFEPAMRAFVEPDPEKRAQIRRNFLWCGVDNSSAIKQGNPQGGGAHNEVEQDSGLLAAGSFFDQYLATMFASVMADLESRTSLGVISGIEALRRSDENAKRALYDLVGALRDDRYRMR